MESALLLVLNIGYLRQILYFYKDIMSQISKLEGENKMKKFMLFFSVLCLAVFLAACGGKADLTITSFTDELQDVIDVFEEKHDVTVDLQIIMTENYTTTLQTALESDEEEPDVFTVDICYVTILIYL